jgi:hypothetical protein
MKNSPPKLRRHTNPRETGIALVTVLVMLVLVATLVSVTSLLALGNRRSSTDNTVTVRSQYAAEAGIENAINELFYKTKQAWQDSTDDDQQTGQPAPKFDTCALKKWLTGAWDFSGTIQAGSVQSADMVAAKNNNSACQYDILLQKAKVTTIRFPSLYNDNIERSFPTYLDKDLDATNGVSYTVSVRRQDDSDTGMVSLFLKSTGQIKSSNTVVAKSVVEQTIRLNTKQFEGDKFALLTNDVNCSFCHLQVDGMRRVYSKANSGENFERVRMGVLSKLNIDNSGHNADSLVAGTMYVRPNTAPASNGEVYSSKWSSNKAGYVDVGAASLVADTTKKFVTNIISVDANTGKTADISKGRLYHNYPTAARVETEFGGKWPDGPLPDAFPSVIPEQTISGQSDINGVIERAEWNAYVKNAPAGTLTSNVASGAKIYGVRRPSSGTHDSIGDVDTTIPVSYDPGAVNNNATTVTNATRDALLKTDLDSLLNGWTQAKHDAFVPKWKGWLIQQALASPNNRSYSAFSATRTTSPIDLKKDIEWSRDANGLVTARNNFYVRFVPAKTGNTLELQYTDASSTPVARKFIVPILQTDVFPSASNAAADDLATGTKSLRSGYFNGNVIIDAGRLTSSNVDQSINITGTVHINGDLVIRGVVTGSGRIIARGNIYVVGDLVYGCPLANQTASAKYKPCGVSDYAAPDALPRLALMAGGNILIGDYAHPDFRASRSQFDLRNDFWRINNTASIFEQIPGSSGALGANSGCNGGSGFVRSLAAKANLNSKTNNSGKRYYQNSPFGFIDTQNGCGSLLYIDTVPNAALMPLFPSNGPLLSGDRSSDLNASSVAVNLGTSSSTQLVQGLGCSTSANGGSVGSFLFGYWCPPSAGSYVRTTVMSGTNPSATTAWTAVNSMNTRLESTSTGRGPSTGWMAGLVGWNGANFTQLGDLSQMKLLKMMWLMTMDDGNRDADPETVYTTETTANKNIGFGPLRTDGMFYTKNGLFGVARYYTDVRNTTTPVVSSTQSRWLHNGSVIASDLGFLITGYVENSSSTFTSNRGPNAVAEPSIDFRPSPKADNTGSNQIGPAMGVFYDERLSGFLSINNDQAVEVQKYGGYTPGVVK